MYRDIPGNVKSQQTIATSYKHVVILRLKYVTVIHKINGYFHKKSERKF